jgi:alpha/beta superfamily hydrolase
VPDLPVAAIGYSFGCALLPRIESVESLAALVLIAPTVAKHDHAPFQAVRRPMLVIAPEDDFATETSVVRQWFDSLNAPRQLLTTRLDNHFFRGHEAWLVETIFTFLQARWR